MSSMEFNLKKQLLTEFHNWCGLLSIDEIMGNSNLIKLIERFEHDEFFSEG